MTINTNLPRLDDVLKLAAIEQGVDGARWKARTDAIVASGVPTNLLTPENFPTLMEPGLRKVFHEALRDVSALYKRGVLFPTDRSTKRSEKTQGVGELGLDVFNQFERTGRTVYDDFAPTWASELVHREFTAGVAFRRKTIDDNQYLGDGIPSDYTRPVRKQARALALFLETSAADVFNNAFTDSGLDRDGFPVSGPDGVGLCSTAHKRSPRDATTQSNEFNLALTPANLTAVALAMRGWTDDRGNLAGVMPRTLVVAPNLEETANIINTSDRDPFTANNTPNPHKGRWNVVVWDFLKDPDAWFVLDDGLKAEHLVWYDRIAPEFNAERDFDTHQAKFAIYCRFSRGWDDWRWIAGSNPN